LSVERHLQTVLQDEFKIDESQSERQQVKLPRKKKIRVENDLDPFQLEVCEVENKSVCLSLKKRLNPR